MYFKTLCRNPYCLKPIDGEPPVKVYCDVTCRVQSHRYWKSLSGETRKAAQTAFERSFRQAFRDAYGIEAFGIEVQLDARTNSD